MCENRVAHGNRIENKVKFKFNIAENRTTAFYPIQKHFDAGTGTDTAIRFN